MAQDTLRVLWRRPVLIHGTYGDLTARQWSIEPANLSEGQHPRVLETIPVKGGLGTQVCPAERGGLAPLPPIDGSPSEDQQA